MKRAVKWMLVILMIAAAAAFLPALPAGSPGPEEESLADGEVREAGDIWTGGGSRADGEKEADPAVKEVILHCGAHAGRAEAEAQELLDALAASDEVTGWKWQKIVNYWQYANTEMEVHTGALPRGLDDSERLCIVILGLELSWNGGMRNELIGRLRTGLACAEQYPRAYVLCTGGATAPGNPGVTEAGQMADWLAQQGVARERLLVEDQAETTAQNAMLSRQLLKRQCPEVKYVAIVSSDYHVPAGCMLFEAAFILEGGANADPPPTVVANAAWGTAGAGSFSNALQTAGLLELAGFPREAAQLYLGRASLRDLM